MMSRLVKEGIWRVSQLTGNFRDVVLVQGDEACMGLDGKQNFVVPCSDEPNVVTNMSDSQIGISESILIDREVIEPRDVISFEPNEGTTSNSEIALFELLDPKQDGIEEVVGTFEQHFEVPVASVEQEELKSEVVRKWSTSSEDESKSDNLKTNKEVELDKFGDEDIFLRKHNVDCIAKGPQDLFDDDIEVKKAADNMKIGAESSSSLTVPAQQMFESNSTSYDSNQVEEMPSRQDNAKLKENGAWDAKDEIDQLEIQTKEEEGEKYNEVRRETLAIENNSLRGKQEVQVVANAYEKPSETRGDVSFYKEEEFVEEPMKGTAVKEIAALAEDGILHLEEKAPSVKIEECDMGQEIAFESEVNSTEGKFEQLGSEAPVCSNNGMTGILSGYDVAEVMVNSESTGQAEGGKVLSVSPAAAEASAETDITENDKKLIEENQKLKEMMEKLIQASKEQLNTISNLSGRIKELEKRLVRKKLKMRKSRMSSPGSSCRKHSTVNREEELANLLM